LFNKEGSFTTDYYFTDFQNQIIVDWEKPREVSFYNLNGKSTSHSFQAQVDYELVKNLDIRLAYRYFDVKATYNDNNTYLKPLTANQRAFVNIGYETANNWLFDATFNWIGEKRIPSTQANPVNLQNGNKSPSYVLLSGQITKKWNSRLDVYIGVENALNFKQQNPIIDNNNPYGDYFDSSLIWGPVFGRNIYAGLRFKMLK
jgi:outer membrane receptor protein involved in Fe transport